MSIVKVAVINPGSKVAEVRTIDPQLEGFQALVGGWIEMLTLTEEVSAYINEEGKGMGLPRNMYGDLYVRATLSRTGRTLLPGDYIAGPVVLVGAPDRGGWDTSVSEDVLEELRQAGMTVQEVSAA